MGIALALSAGLVRFLFEQTVIFPWLTLATILVGTVVLSLGVGWLVSRPPEHDKDEAVFRANSELTK